MSRHDEKPVCRTQSVGTLDDEKGPVNIYPFAISLTHIMISKLGSIRADCSHVNKLEYDFG